ncbi:MAG TPA: TlyA family RNA methyltransferase [Candidatus Nanoperiomorbaceae bacterium]|jgi:23S rRNA (cytidine1920-2'-O)/16S rRNA (cytidine1409-2'-O)-methyltransferase|nr:TlyA family RNA methyltransferase [Candidatus Nanoperiomorbaceae bacterium]HMU11996.1 TlyA family RNA methyltransferase [Candidatus Nanoperiomorbaceae bacterium]
MKVRLDHLLVQRGLVATRSQAESYIRLGKVTVADKIITKPGYFVDPTAAIELLQDEQYVSRAGLKLASVAELLHLDFRDKVVLDVGSSTGGFTDYALRRGAAKVIAVDVGTDQMHPSLRSNPQVELYEKTDIRDFHLDQAPNIVVIDVSFISLREILPHIAKQLSNGNTQIVAMVKPQFETGSRLKNAGVIKNNTDRRHILQDFELWSRQYFVIRAKADSDVAGTHGNRERFYVLETTKRV